jgi:dihydroorotate dehydrogenase
MYEKILKPIFFRFEPERIHDFFAWVGEGLGSNPLTRWVVAESCDYEHPSLVTRVAGIDFRNPIGLGAGFDKDVRLTKIMPSVGFGFMEVGAITHFPYEGNKGPRLARLPDDRSLIVNYGLKNYGAEVIRKKMEHLYPDMPVGVNIAKTNRADIKGEKSVEDYIASYKMLAHYFSYVTLNISCPNAQDGCTFQDPAMLEELLAALGKEMLAEPPPIFLQISSHLSMPEVDAILAVVEKYPFITGFVVSNLAKKRDILALQSTKEQLNVIPQGGISGAPVKGLSTEMVRYIYKKTGGKYILIGLGGVFTAEDAYEKIKAGASLVQMVTGLIYGGPMAVKRINKGLVKLLARDGYASVADAVGKGAPGE